MKRRITTATVVVADLSGGNSIREAERHLDRELALLVPPAVGSSARSDRR